MSGHINCSICGAKIHSVSLHLKKDHPDWDIARYKAQFPDAPVLSAVGREKMIEAKKQQDAGNAAAVKTILAELQTEVSVEAEIPASVVAPETPAGVSNDTGTSVHKQPLHVVFGLDPKLPGMLNSQGDYPTVSVYNPHEPEMVPDVDPNYVFDVDTLKNALLAFEMNINMYVWGHTGTGKTTMLEQICARTRRMMLRIQHTVNTEESHIVGQWTAQNGSTKFELGPLAIAMQKGYVYLADEYDFALPSVLSVYQPVLEGKPLVIKEADAGNRVIKPHPNFRFVATGNTNGSGDESGLYQGTQMQNAANYDRFNMVIQMRYMEPKMEADILVKQLGIEQPDANKMVKFANQVREAYGSNKLSAPVSPRTLIAITKIGLAKANFRQGVSLAFSNKMSRVDKETVDGIAQREFS